jgi:HlyD family secretion protein
MDIMKRKLIVIALTLASVAGAGAFYRSRGNEAPRYQTVEVTRGAIVDTVDATGTVEPVDPVEIGSQVTGTIVALGTDFNQQVKKGQIVATLDPATFQAQVDQSQASMTRLQAEVDRARIQVVDAKQKLVRAQALAKEGLSAAQDLDAAAILADANQAALKSADANLAQSAAALSQSRVNLEHSIIRSPVDGIVLSRDVEIGQTVSASTSAPTLFVVARDLKSMRVNAAVDESDVGRVKEGQTVHFRVDAYGQEEFTGTVSEVRLQPVVTSGVVSYPTVIDVPNVDLKLKPGMTATVSIEVARADDVLQIPVSALRFRPTAEQLGVTANANGANGDSTRGNRGSRRNGSTNGAASANANGVASANGATTANGSSANGSSPTGTNATRTDGDTRIVWRLNGDKLERVRIKVGLSTATHIAVLSGPLDAGAMLVTGVAQTTTATAQPTTNSPLMPSMPRRGNNGGGNTGGGRRGN